MRQLSGVGGATRPGIVHRLDRDTSGAIVVAKTDAAHEALAAQFHDREVAKEYLAIVAGSPDRDADRVVASIGPHPSHREKMAIREDHPDSRPAETFFEVVERFPGFALVRAKPKTGRTHQIRLHLAHLRTARAVRPAVRRPVANYCRRAARNHATCDALAICPTMRCCSIGRRCMPTGLRLRIRLSGKPLEFEAPLAPDMERLLAALARNQVTPGDAMMGFMQEFKKFAVRGNVIDMAVGIVIGGAFTKIVTSLVTRGVHADHGVPDGEHGHLRLFNSAAAALPGRQPAAIGMGAVVQAIIEFMIVAFALFLVVRGDEPAPGPGVDRADSGGNAGGHLAAARDPRFARAVAEIHRSGLHGIPEVAAATTASPKRAPIRLRVPSVRGLMSSSPAAKPATSPRWRAQPVTRSNTCSFSFGNCVA